MGNAFMGFGYSDIFLLVAGLSQTQSAELAAAPGICHAPKAC